MNKKNMDENLPCKFLIIKAFRRYLACTLAFFLLISIYLTIEIQITFYYAYQAEIQHKLLREDKIFVTDGVEENLGQGETSFLAYSLTGYPQSTDLSQNVKSQNAKSQTCARRLFTSSMIFAHKNLLWCPTAKAATTYTYRYLKYQFEHHGVNFTNQGWRCGRAFRCGNILAEANRRCLSFKPFSCLIEKDERVLAKNDSEICEEREKYFAFTTIRNPWDRVYSAYKGKIKLEKKTKQYYFYKRFGEKGTTPTFTDFVRGIANQDPKDMDPHWMTFEERCHTSGPNEFNYDLILRFEDGIDSGLEKIFQHQGLDVIKPPETRSNTNKTLAARFDAYLNVQGLSYPTELVDLIAKTYSADIKRFNYSFDRFT